MKHTLIPATRWTFAMCFMNNKYFFTLFNETGTVEYANCSKCIMWDKSANKWYFAL